MREAEAAAAVESSGLLAADDEGASGLVGMDEPEAKEAEPTAFITEEPLQTIKEESFAMASADAEEEEEKDEEGSEEEEKEKEEDEKDEKEKDKNEEEDEDEDENEEPRVRREPTLESLLANDSLWDTDLEDELPDEDHEDLHDTTGRAAYRKLCEKLGAVPVKYFMKHITDTELIMRYHGLGPVGTRAIARPLTNNLTITRLDLTGNWMEAEGGEAIAKMLEENAFITHLNLADNRLGDDGVAPICRVLQVNASLTTLSLAGNGIGEASAEALHSLVAGNRSLVTLDLSRNCLGPECASRLGTALGANEFLEDLDLGSNCIGAYGGVDLAHGLRETFRLKRCSLAWNGLAEDGGLAMADMIRHNQTLLEINLQGNRLNGRAAVAIGNSVAANETLQSLHLGNNFLYTPTLVEIVTAIVNSEVTSLTFLSFKDIPVDFEFVKIVERQVAKATRDFKCEHGPVLRAGNAKDDLRKEAVDIKSPIVMLKEHLLVNDFRFVERLVQLDVEDTKTVTVEQFASVLDEMKIPYYRSQLLEMRAKMDKLGNGTIFYGGLLPPERPRRESAIIRSRPADE